MTPTTTRPTCGFTAAVLGIGLLLPQTAALAQEPFALAERLPNFAANGPSEFAPLAVGPAHVVLVANNSDIVIFRKATVGAPAQQLQRASIRTFFANPPGPVDRLTDPDVVFDPDAQRFFVALADTTASKLQLLLAVSKSATPATLGDQDWYFYRLDRNDAVDEADFDHLAIAGDRLLVSWQRTLRPPSGPVGAGTAIRVFDKRPFLSGATPDPKPIDLVLANAQNLRARPARIASARDRATDRVFYDISSGFGANGHLAWQIGAVTGLPSNPILVTREVESPFDVVNNPTQIPQPNGAPSIAQRRLAASPSYRDGSLWVFEWYDGASAGTTSGIYWMEIDVRNWPATPSVVQSGIYREPGVWLFAPAGIVDQTGNLVLTFTRSGFANFPSNGVAGRLVTDLRGTLRSGATLQQGSRTWDFTASPLTSVVGAAIDPVDGSVWISGITPVPIKPPTNDSALIAIGRLQPGVPVASDSSRLSNVSVRTALAASQTLIVGFVVSGEARDILVRAAGPALTQFGLTAAMTDPRLELYKDGVKIFENDNWPATLAANFAGVGAFSFLPASKDAALVQTLSGGNSAFIAGTGPGTVLAEIYDAGGNAAGRLSNISARNRVGTGADILIAGFTLTGTGTKRLLIRAVGPTIGAAPFNVPGTLADPKLELYDANAAKIDENDNWDGSLAATFASVGAFALATGSKDSALIATVNAGRNYTVQVKGADGGTGEALIEVYELP